MENAQYDSKCIIGIDVIQFFVCEVIINEVLGQDVIHILLDGKH